MVIVEPYRWIKSTAIKERLDLANKLNEVIDVLNGGVVTIEDIDLTVSSDGVFTFVFTLSDGAIKEMSFSMGDYITNEITSRMTDYVSKTGISIVTGDIRVPTTPANPLSVVNSLYVNDASEGVNNLGHKTGNEIFDGEKKYLKPCLMLDKAIGFKAGSNTDYLEIIKVNADREMVIELFANSYDLNMIVCLTPSNWALVKGIGKLIKDNASYTVNAVITDNGDGTLSLWVLSTTAFCAYVKRNKNWRNNLGIEEGYTTPNTISTTDPRVSATRYKDVVISTEVIQ